MGSVERDDAKLSQAAAPVDVTTPGSTASREAAEVAAGLLDDVAEMLARAQEELGALDSVAGDGDHGIGMANGSRAAAGAAHAAVSAGGGLRTTLNAARGCLVQPGRRHFRGAVGRVAHGVGQRAG